MMPRAGGQYVFLREAYSPMFGFLFGWAMFLVVQTGTIAAVAVAFAKFLGVFWPRIAADAYLVEPIRLGGYALSLSTQQLVAVVLIVFLTAVNMCGLKLGKWIQNSFTFTKTAALLGLIVLGLSLGANAAARPGRPPGGIRRPTAGTRRRPRPTSRWPARWRCRCCSAWP